MEIKLNKDETVTINATKEEYNMITSAIVLAYNNACINGRYLEKYYQPIIDALNKACNEQVASRLDREL